MDTQEDDDNFLSRFKGGFEDVGDNDCRHGEKDDVRKAFGQRANNAQALPSASERPLCKECGREDEENGGGRYGVDDHEGLFYCGRCWRAWDDKEKEAIMKPLWQQKKEQVRNDTDDEIDNEIGRLEERLRELKAWKKKRQMEKENFFDQFKAGEHEGTDSIEGAWDPSKKTINDSGNQALPGSWERPICVECGNDEGEAGGGRYGHGPDSQKFFCGRCWKSWDGESQRKMMMAYSRADRHSMDPMLHMPPPCDPMDPMDFDNDPGFFGMEGDDEEHFDGIGGNEESYDKVQPRNDEEYVD